MEAQWHSCRSVDETRHVGVQLGETLHPGQLVTLSGPLGAGKTTFAQGIAQGLGLSEAVTSPTYVLINEYSGPVPLLHLDAYRLEGAGDQALHDAGIGDLLNRTDAVKLIEWPEMIEAWLPGGRTDIVIEIAGTSRTIRINRA